MVEKPFEKIDKRAQDSVEAPPPPDPVRWWEKQLGIALPHGLYTELSPGR